MIDGNFTTAQKFVVEAGLIHACKLASCSQGNLFLLGNRRMKISSLKFQNMCRLQKLIRND